MFICIQAPICKICFLILEISISYSEGYLEPSQSSKMELFYENSERVKTINYLCKKATS